MLGGWDLVEGAERDGGVVGLEWWGFCRHSGIGHDGLRRDGMVCMKH